MDDAMTRRTVLGGLLLALLATAPSPALAQAGDMTVSGSVIGVLAPQRTARFEVTATHPDGWGTLKELSITMDLHGAQLDVITFDLDAGTINAGVRAVLFGTGDQTNGRFFRIRALDVSQTTGGDRAQVTFDAQVIEAVPQGTRFVFAAVDDFGSRTTVTRAATVPEADEGGFPWSTLALAVLGALLAGGYLGSQVASHRRRRGNIYETVAKRIEEEHRARARNERAASR